MGVANQKLSAAARRERTLQFAGQVMKRERKLAQKASTAAVRAAAVRPPIEKQPPTFDDCLDDELERAREQNDVSARELSAARATIQQLRLELVRLRAIAEPTRADIKARRTRVRVRACSHPPLWRANPF
jgi:hypothetical protein